MMAGGFDNIKAWGREWRRQAETADFLGEVALSVDDLERKLDVLSEYRKRLYENPDTSFALAVAAVNWAYYRPDQDPSCLKHDGFVKPFVQRMCGDADSRHWPALGRVIEEAITSWAGTPPRPPVAWKYVGLIREHVGLPEDQIPRFVEVLRNLRRDPGWHAITPASSARIRDAVCSTFGQSTYAATFLCSSTGLELITWACRSLARLEDQFYTAEDLKSLHVYRPGFMARVAASLDVKPDDPRRQPRPDHWVPPEFVLDLASCRLLLRFDSAEVLKGHMSCDQCGGTVFDFVIPIGERLRPRNAYSGIRKAGDGGQTEAWEIPAWAPAGDWALFEEKGRLVCHAGQDVVVPWGSYLLVIDDKLQRGTKGLETSHHYGALDFEWGQSTYSILAVELKPGVTIPGLSLRTSALQSVPQIQPSISQPWAHMAYVDVAWAAGAVEAMITDWTAENQRRYRLYCQINGQITRPEVVAGTDGTGAICLGDLTSACSGRLWLEDMRLGRLQRPSPLNFAIMPSCQVLAPVDLLADSDTPEIAVISDGNKVVFTPIRPDDATAVGNNRWKASDRLSRLDGVLDADGTRVPIAIPLHRARLRMVGSANEQLILTPEALSEMCRQHREGGESVALELSALPDSAATLIFRPLEPDSAHVEMLTRAITASGRVTILPNEFAEAITRSQAAAGCFEVRCAGRTVPTDTWYIDPKLLGVASWLSNLKGNLPAWLGWLLHGSDEQPPPPQLGAMKAKWLYAQHLIEGASFPAWATRSLDANDSASLKRVRALLDAAGVGVLRRTKTDPDVAISVEAAQHVRADWRRDKPVRILRDLGVVRHWWVSQLRLIARRIRERGSLRRWLEILHSAPSTGTVSVRLVNAVSSYQRAEALNAGGMDYLGAANELLNAALANDDLDPLQRECAQVLRALVLLRLGYIRWAVHEIVLKVQQHHFVGSWSQLKAVGKLALDSRFEAPAVAAGTLNTLSPRQDDAMLAAAVLGDAQAWFAASEHSWLNAWLAWRWSVATESSIAQQTALLEVAMRHAMGIPRTQDGNHIRVEIADGQVQEWNLHPSV